jgi:hypothetical protein
MKKILATLLVLTCLATIGQAQEFGLSFSYFIPRNGYFSTPISPFSFRGLGVDLNKYLALETGISLYRMSGLTMRDLPFESKNSLVGPNFTVFIPAEFVIQFAGRKAQFDIKAGGFFFHGFDQKLNYGNFDRAIRTYKSWDVANADLSFKNNPGFGYHFGVELLFNVNRQFAISIETNYLAGQSKLPIKGQYTGGLLAGPLQTELVDYADGKVDFTGLEFSIGVIMRGGR